MSIKRFNNFLLEKQNDIDSDISIILNIVSKQPLDIIIDFRDCLKDIVYGETINENFLSDSIVSLKYKFRKWFTDTLFKYLINRKRKFYERLINKLNVFDLENLDDVYDAFPAFKLNSMYLAGGMDAAKEGGKVGWRNFVEYEFEKKRLNESVLPEVEIYLGESGRNVKIVKPSFVVDDIFLNYFIESPKKCLKLYKKPALLNPVRKEVDRNKVDFDKYFKNLKDNQATDKEVQEAVMFFRKIFNNYIIPDDENLINNVDAIFLGLNTHAGSGTYAELQLLSFIEKPLFTALVEDSENKMGSFKLWNYPQLCKLSRNNNETKILINSLYKYANNF